MLSGSAGRQAVGFPQLVNDLLFLHGGGNLLLLQQGAGPLHVEDVLIFLLSVPFRPGLGGFRLRPALQGLLHLPIHFGTFPVVLLLALLKGGDLPLQAGGILPDGIYQGQLFLPVALHCSPEAFQILDMGQRGGTLGIQRRFPGF